MTTTTMKTLSVKMTDIWMDCQKQMIDMQNEIKRLKSALKTTDEIRKYLEICNETLVSIIELCQLDVTNSGNSSRSGDNNKIQVLVGSVRQLESSIEREKQNLKTSVVVDITQDRHEFIRQKTINRLNRDWNHWKKLKTNVLTYDKSIQTIKEVKKSKKNNDLSSVPVVCVDKQLDDNYLINNDVINGKEEEDIISCQPIGDNVVNNDDNNINVWKDIESDDDDKDRDFAADDEDNDNNFNDSDGGGSDVSDFVSTKKTKKKKKKKSTTKTAKQIQFSKSLHHQRHQKKMNDMVMPLKSDVDDQYRCDQTGCQFSCGDKKRMYRHLMKHKNNCGFDKDVDEGDGVSRQMKTRAEPYKQESDGFYVCNKLPDCHYRTRNCQNLFKHFRRHKKKSDKFRTDMSQSADQRIKKMLDNFIFDDQYVCLREGCQYRCPVADRDVFYRHYNEHNRLSEPVPTNDPQRPFGCDQCPIALRDHYNYRRHKLDVHPVVPYVCNQGDCRIRIKCLKHLVDHWNNIHRKVRRHECDWPGCGYRAYALRAVRQHKLIHSTVKGLSCEWPGCQFQCKVKYVLETHRRTHTREKPFKCDWPGCTYMCAQQGALTVHMRRHTGEKPYECLQDGCGGKRFSSLAGLYAHRKQHASGNSRTGNRGRGRPRLE
ncbi:zinc finger protein 436-like [Oppia nitens]|uniref:zinc finger protein 436-like n=1 Tax=Oppia nitens TaxID=1686743 RepID=UPI0023DBBD87|nr:zinc finger protein 436-like [Oppia nitens]